MEYFKILNFDREPFSNSPVPVFLYKYPHHVESLQKLELAVRIRRGLNVVIGDVGTGKTTLSRQLIRKFADDEEVTAHLLLDPHFSTESEFLKTVAEMFGAAGATDVAPTDWQLRERIKKYLFEEAVEHSKIVVLIIDEGQKIPDFCLEILREFLNFETNEYKLLQIVIFAQEEFRDVLAGNPGFADRINLNYGLGPLNFRDTKAMVLFRIEQALEGGKEIPVRFTWGAMREIYRATGGYPRKIVRLCHQVLLTLIIQNRKRAGRAVVRSVANRTMEGGAFRLPWSKAAVLAGLLIVLSFVIFEKDYFSKKNITGEIIAQGVPAVEKKIEPAFAKEAAPASALDNSRIMAKAPATAMPKISEDPQKSEIREEYRQENSGTLQAEQKSAAVIVSKGMTNDTAGTINHAATPSRRTYPEILGQVKMKKDTIVWRMIEDIYGRCNVRMMRLVAAVNPHIRDLDKIVAGDIVNIPTIPLSSSAAVPDYPYLVEIAAVANLEEALTLYRNSRKTLSSAKLVPYWNDEEGLRFVICLKERFKDMAAAQKGLSELPSDIAAKGKIISDWKTGTVFFAAL